MDKPGGAQDDHVFHLKHISGLRIVGYRDVAARETWLQMASSEHIIAIRYGSMDLPIAALEYALSGENEHGANRIFDLYNLSKELLLGVLKVPGGKLLPVMPGDRHRYVTSGPPELLVVMFVPGDPDTDEHGLPYLKPDPRFDMQVLPGQAKA